MEWTDDAIVLSVKAHGETSAIVAVLAREHGRHSGLVRGGSSRRMRAMLQPGNSVRAHWRARLAEHLGNFSIELVTARAGEIMDRRAALAGLNAFTSMASAVLPEREPHRPAFDAAKILLDALVQEEFRHWGVLYVRWELGLLHELGFGLDLSHCAATGSTDDLIYVSPRSGRAVSREAGDEYRARLFALPRFLLGSQDALPRMADIAEGLRLTEHFLFERVLKPHGRTVPAARHWLGELALGESD